ncbi:MAG TPA: ATP-dependent RNA helicase HrpA [Polyangiaceae bacterium]|nr:ATP-dependent RNA helicase HrpA [Polyangiaceae bacterium]
MARAEGPPGRVEIRFPEELPISARVLDIARAIDENPVVVVAGETGSGKTTQLPKICLAMGRGVHGLIGCTQPRRIAATSVAARVAHELGTPLGDDVGYKIRFQERLKPTTYVKFMTDGILLAEVPGDPLLRAYDTIILDEAHERSLNVDFLLGYLKRLLPRRPDLRVVVSSATLETARFAEFFDGAPIVEVSGRTHPVEVLYRPPLSDGRETGDLAELVGNAVEEITERDRRGDVLVFLPGEREIRDSYDELASHGLPHTVLLPLYGRLAAADQARVFQPTPQRRVVLATNVAETSLTIPGIKYVVDTGLARVKRYNPRTGVTQLQVEPIARANADQRKGRAGRTAAGVCLRLYAEEDYASRPAYPDPELKRSDLAGVILRMLDLGLGEVEAFPFLDPPPPRAIAGGYQVLEELGALDEARALTELGRKLSRFPLDPRIGRMVLGGAAEGSLAEVLVVAAALSVQDPRERPALKQKAADDAHAAFRDEGSDFVGLLRLWRAVGELRQKAPTKNQFRRALGERYLSWQRVLEWQDVHGQLADIAVEARLAGAEAAREARGPALVEGAARRARPPRGARGRPGGEARDGRGAGPGGEGRGGRGAGPGGEGRGAGPGGEARDGRGAGTAGEAPGPEGEGGEGADPLHRALLPGLLSRVGMYKPEQRAYAGARQARFVLHPSSGLAKKPPAWVMAAELVETSQLFARNAARIDPTWLEAAGAHLCKRAYQDPHWEQKPARVMAYENVTLYGLPVVRGRKVHYGPLDPPLARRLFVRHALVRGEYATKAPFLAHNLAVMHEAQALRDKARRGDLLVDEESLAAFFEARLPEGIVDGKTFEAWRRQAEAERPDLLHLGLADVLLDEAAELTPARYPDELVVAGVRLPLTYLFDPSADEDGISVALPLALLPQLDPGIFDWTIPGWLSDKLSLLLHNLPKPIKRELGPIGPLVEALVPRLRPFAGPMLPALSRELAALTGADVPERAFDLAGLPPYVSFFFRVRDEEGRPVAEGRDLRGLRERLALRAGGLWEGALTRSGLRREGLTDWPPLDPLPESIEVEVGGFSLKAYPALVDEGAKVALRPLPSAEAAREAHRAGLRRLFTLQSRQALSAAERQLPRPLRLSAAALKVLPPLPDLGAALLDRAVDEAFALDDEAAWPRTRRAYEERLRSGRAQLGDALAGLARLARDTIEAVAALAAKLEASARVRPLPPPALDDLRSQLAHLLPKDAFFAYPPERLRQLPRYLRAAHVRVERLANDPVKDREKQALVQPFWDNYLRRLGDPDTDPAALDDYRWLVEEYRVSVFAPELKAAVPVSPQRLKDLWSLVVA